MTDGMEKETGQQSRRGSKMVHVLDFAVSLTSKRMCPGEMRRGGRSQLRREVLQVSAQHIGSTQSGSAE